MTKCLQKAAKSGMPRATVMHCNQASLRECGAHAPSSLTVGVDWKRSRWLISRCHRIGRACMMLCVCRQGIALLKRCHAHARPSLRVQVAW